MKKASSNRETKEFHFQDPQFCRIPWDTASQLWPLLENTPLRRIDPTQPAGLLELPELTQLEMALILIRRRYLQLKFMEGSPKFDITLELLKKGLNGKEKYDGRNS